MRILTFLILLMPSMCFCEDIFSKKEYPDFDFFLPLFLEIDVAKTFTFGSVDENNRSIIQGDFLIAKSIFAMYRDTKPNKSLIFSDIRFFASFLAGYQRIVPFYSHTFGIEKGFEYNEHFYENDKILLGGAFRLEGAFTGLSLKVYAEYSFFLPLYSKNSEKFIYNNIFLSQKNSTDYAPLHGICVGFRDGIYVAIPETDDSDSYILSAERYPSIFNVGLMYLFSATQQSFGVYCSIGIFFPE